MKVFFPLLVALLVMSFSPSPQAYTIRDAYHDIPIAYLPSTQAYLKGKTDNNENRDKILTYHNEEREFIKLNHSGSNLTGKLKLYISGTDIFVAIEHTYCRSSKCENHFVILKKKGGSFVDVSNEVLSDYDFNLSKIRGIVKKEMKSSYGSNDYYESSGLEDDNTLKEHIFWEIDEQSGNISLKETSLPFTVAEYAWDTKKGTFKKK